MFPDSLLTGAKHQPSQTIIYPILIQESLVNAR